MSISYFLLASAVSIFYGFRGYSLFESSRKIERWHQAWFNFAGSAVGWLVGFWLILRFRNPQSIPGVVEVVLLIPAALGIVGYLPQTLNAIPGLLEHFAELARKKLQQSVAKADAVSQ